MSLVLHQFVIDWDLPNPSPFCLKVETFLRMVDLPYDVEPWTPMKAPLGKAPVIVLDGEVIADSSVIIRRLCDTLPTPFDDAHDPAALVRAQMVARLLEEHTYHGLLILRWLQDAPWASYRHVIGQALPAVVRRPMTWWLRRGVQQAVYAQGLGRHPIDEVVLRVRQDLAAVEAQLEGPYLLGSKPCRHDATVYAFLEALGHPLGTEALAPAFAPGTPLHTYRQFMREQVWSDWSFP